MTLKVLQSKSDISMARKEMKERSISFTDCGLEKLFKRLGLSSSLSLGDPLKSWDVLETVKFAESYLQRDAAVLDIGCFCSEILLCLHNLGYGNLTGCDLNSEIETMPFADSIDYRQDNFMSSTFSDESFDAITSISVLEHGFDSHAFLSEISRILRPQGYLVSSFDYWPEKIDTGDTTFFGMTWTLFSREEIYQFIEDAKQYGLSPLGQMNPDASGRPIKFGGFEYTFGWLALQKRA